jgi:hypothetical protein
MNQNTPLWGTVRTIVAAGLAYAAGKGWLPADGGGELAAALTTIAVAAWSIWAKKAS